MGISSQALASLVIAGTAIGGSTFAVMANSAPSEINSPSISQISDTDPSAKLPGETPAPVDGAGNPVDITPVNPSPTPVPTPLPTTPVLPPIDFGGNGDDEEDEDGNDDSYEESDEDDHDDYGHDGHHGDHDDEEDDEDYEDEEEDD
ncbi:MAG: hypothetical protein ACOYKO_05560 [Rhodoluna sp.]